MNGIRHKDHFHGSDLEKIEEIYGIKKEDIVSFAANVNPLGISPKLKTELSDHIDVISNYPDREYKRLRESIAAYAGCRSDQIIVGNGSTELISLFIQITNPKNACILGPTYSEYEREISLIGGHTRYYPLKAERNFRLELEDFLPRLTDNIDLLVICNPNNPTGTYIRRGEMRRILDVCMEHGIYVMVDETYVEFVSDIDEVTAVPLTSYYNNIIILRGTSKFFAAPGLRLGYAITGNQDLISNISKFKNPWMINSLAETAGIIMFSDTEYIEKTRSLIASEKKRMFEVLESDGRYTPYPSGANFILVRINAGSCDATGQPLTAGYLFDRAIRQGLMIRDCSTFPFLDDSYFRFCVMKPEDNDRLLEVLLK